MRCFFKKLPGGSLVPDNDETAEWLQKVKTGSVVSGEFVQPRNYKFLKKMHALFQLAYQHFDENIVYDLDYKGHKVRSSYDRFRKELVILAGHYEPVFNIKGELRLEAKSISYSKCTQEEAERIFSDCINAALKHIYKFCLEEEELRAMVNSLLEFA